VLQAEFDVEHAEQAGAPQLAVVHAVVVQLVVVQLEVDVMPQSLRQFVVAQLVLVEHEAESPQLTLQLTRPHWAPAQDVSAPDSVTVDEQPTQPPTSTEPAARATRMLRRSCFMNPPR
jgi:hypothetical protein